MHQTHLLEGDLGREDDVGAVSLVVRVLLVPEDEGDVGGRAVGRLVSLPGEGDLGPRFPAFLHHHVQHLLLGAQAAAPVGVEAAAGDLHVLGAPLHHLVQGHQQVVHHLVALQPPLASPRAVGEPARVAVGEPPEGVEGVLLGVVVVAEEDVEVVGAVEEGGEGGVGIRVGVTAGTVALARL